MIEMNAAAKAYVRFVMDELKLSPSGLAKLAGLATTTLTRALNDPEHKFSLSTSTIDKIAKASGISPSRFYTAGDFVEMSMIPFETTDLYDESWGANSNASREELDSEESEGHYTLVLGEAAAGVWRDPTISTLEEQLPLSVGLARTRDRDAFALLVADDSASKVARKGEHALCYRRTDQVRNFAGHGELMVVERWSENRRLMELSIRRMVRPENAPAYLRLESDLPQHQEIIVLDGAAGSERLKLIGQVAWVARRVIDEELNEEAYQRALAKLRAERGW